MAEFTNICIGTPMPLHDYLVDNPNLCVKLLVGAKSAGETPFVKGDLNKGLWEIDSNLKLPEGEQTLTLAIVAKKRNRKKEFVVATLNVPELLAGVKTSADEHREFSTRNYSVEFTVNCSIKVSSSTSVGNLTPQPAADDDDTATIRRIEDTLSGLGGEQSTLFSREHMESTHQQFLAIQNPEDRANALSALGSRYQVLYERSGEAADLERAISVHEETMHLTSSHPKLAKYSFRLGNALQKRFTQCGDTSDIEMAIQLHQNALTMTDDGNPDKPRRLSMLGTALQRRFEHLGGISYIQKAVSFQQQAVDLLQDDDPQKSSVLNNLASALLIYFKSRDGLADLEKAISSLHNAVDLTPEGRADRVTRLESLGNALELRFERLANPVDINDAISLKKKVVDITPEGHPDQPGRLTSLGIALRARFERLGSLADIEESIMSLRQAVDLTPEGHPDKLGRVSVLGAALHTRFEQLGNLADIDSAILGLQNVVELTPKEDLNKPGRLNNLGIALQVRFERLGNLADIGDAILSLQEAIELTPEGHAEMPNLLSSLGCALQARFQRLGSSADIDDAISILQRAVDLTPEWHADKPIRLSNLSNALRVRFERLGHLKDINYAIWSAQNAIEIMPEGHPDKPDPLTNLGLALHTRFELLSSLADIGKAISSLQEAADLTGEEHPDNPGQLSNLGSALLSRFERADTLADLDKAISSLQLAVRLMPEGHPEEPVLLSNLGIALRIRFERLSNLADIENAISSLQRAVDLTPEKHPEKPTRLSNLGNVLQTHFRSPRSLGGLTVIEDAISSLQKSVELTPDGHPEKPGRLNNLGNAFLTHFERFKTPENLESALQAYSKAATSPTGPAMVRFTAARAWAQSAEENSRSPLVAYNHAIGLLPRIAWLGLAVTDQHALLANVGSIVRDAVAAAIRSKKYESAVEWAEQGRSIVWQNLLGLRSPVDDLRATHPQLADRLQRISRQLEAPASHNGVSEDTHADLTEDISRGYSELATEWEDTVGEIRRLPNFKSFLKAKSLDELAPAAYEGPVVILNVHKSRCDALVLRPDNSNNRRVSVICIPLERFSSNASQTLFQDLKALLSSAGVRARNTRKHEWVDSPTNGEARLTAILRILWRDVVKPVMEGLAYQAHLNNPPRIWWCATGHLAFLPIHAAGIYNSEIGETVSDYVVSSYTPTLTAILDLSEPTIQEDFQILTVAQPSTPYAQPIPKTEDEVKLVQTIATGVRVADLTKEGATVERVLQKMTESNWMHLACHGEQRVDDPMKSGFLLHDRILQLSEIIKLSLPKADFAFLSACQTAMGDEKMAEESVHLAAGMLLSGCRGVIATMWSIRDEDGPQIAGVVYRQILKGGQPNRKEAAYALHEAVKRLRESGAGFMAWVPFIHIGR